MNNPSVSVVINTFNRAAQLRNALRTLQMVDYDQFEVVVVNGPSTDQTQDVISLYDGAIKAEYCDIANLSKSRNVGVAASSGDIVAFLDDDAIPHPMWLKNLVNSYHDPRVGGVGGFTIDNTGVRWQVKKTICDRFGHAYYASEFFDERPLNRRNSLYFPSVLGANSSFRATHLREIGGFDETFAYFLDETDICLRLVDAGYKILYEPSAVVYHQSAASDLRSIEKIPTTLRPSVVSKSYFIMRHGSPHSLTEASTRLERYREELVNANNWLAQNGRISWDHHAILESDVVDGIRIGCRKARERSGSLMGDLIISEERSFRKFATKSCLRIALISRVLPPNIDAGIARWTKMLADGLAARGHEVHILTEAMKDESVQYSDGIWTHSLCVTDPGHDIAMKYNLPSQIAAWSKRVRQEVQYIRSFGLDVVSFPIWDLEGMALIDDPDIGKVVSLHTSYALAQPFKPEWSARPIYQHMMVDRMIAGERAVLEKAPVILANSNAVVEDMERAYSISIREKVILAPHGTTDLCNKDSAVAPNYPTEDGPLKLLFVGRFEPRKGLDIVVEVASRLNKTKYPIEFTFVGGDGSEIEQYFPQEYKLLIANSLNKFEGKVSRNRLDDLYRETDVVFMPSRYESFGLVAIEGMSAGKPVIGLNSGGLSEIIISNHNGFAVEDGDDAADQCFRHILSLHENRGLLRKLSDGARADFENKFTINAMAEAVEVAYRQAIQTRNAA